MKNLAIILSALAIMAVVFTSCDKGGKNKVTTVTKTDSTGKKVEVEAELSRIAYVDLDTLEAKYKVFAVKKAEFTSREKKIERELTSKAKALEASYVSLQKKAQAGKLTQAEGEKLQKSLIKRQENLEKLRNNLGSKLLKDKAAFQKQLMDKLNDAVTEYTKDNKYDYILSYSKEGSILHVNKKLNVTQEIVELMNK